jgi:hypothetical protein
MFLSRFSLASTVIGPACHWRGGRNDRLSPAGSDPATGVLMEYDKRTTLLLPVRQFSRYFRIEFVSVERVSVAELA